VQKLGYSKQSKKINSEPKPISRILFFGFRQSSYHLSGTTVARCFYQPTHVVFFELPQMLGTGRSTHNAYLVFQPVRFTVPRLLPVER
jgi:hypothetical protein